MMIGLLVAGIAAILAGLLAIVYGLLLELSFGNTLILAGAFGVCSGLIVLAQALVVHELRTLGRKLSSRTAAEARFGPMTVPGGAEDGFASPRNLGASLEAEPAPIPAASAPPWREEATSRDRTREESAIAPPPEVVEPAAQAPRRRNLLFSSTVRRDRELPRQSAGEASPEDPPRRASEAADAPPASFEDAWPRPERPRPSEGAAQRRAARAPSALFEGRPGSTAPDRAASAPRAQEPPESEATVIKSGVVDGMAYSLYSDGSIEAEMPEGMMRFASIDELRAHLDQRP